MITLADNGKMRLVCVEMETRGQHIYDDTKSLFDYAFANFEKEEVDSAVLEKAQKECQVSITEQTPVYVNLPKDGSQEKLKYETGEENGETMLYLTYEGQCVGKVKVALEKGVTVKTKSESEEKASIIESVVKFLQEKQWILIAAAAVVVVLLVIIILWIRRRKRRSFLRTTRRQKRQERRRKRRLRKAASRSRRRRMKRW